MPASEAFHPYFNVNCLKHHNEDTFRQPPTLLKFLPIVKIWETMKKKTELKKSTKNQKRSEDQYKIRMSRSTCNLKQDGLYAVIKSKSDVTK